MLLARASPICPVAERIIARTRGVRTRSLPRNAEPPHDLEQAGVIGHTFSFARGERIHTENSYKYAIDEFQDLARAAGWQPEEVWTDKDSLFSVHELVLHEADLRFRSQPSY